MSFDEYILKYNGKTVDTDGAYGGQIDNGCHLLDNMPMKKLVVNSKTFGRLEVKLDDEDFKTVTSMGKWSASLDRDKYYFHKRISTKEKITLHRFLMKFPRGKYVDHINGDTLDNQKMNLRICSNAANLRNGRIRPNNSSGIIGVRYDISREKWVADIKVNYKKMFLGRFKEKEDAIQARKEAERRYWND